MSAPVWCAELAAKFWATAGTPPAFPRDLRTSVSWFPFSVVSLANLRVSTVCQWLAAKHIRTPTLEPDRRLRGCLFADGGYAYAFIDPTDPCAELRFTLAHEVGHFLRDYWHPRELARLRLGSDILDVLDGKRPVTPTERLHAVLRNATVGPFAHLLRRDEMGRPLTPGERTAEAAADRLAFELLAPAAALEDCTDLDELRHQLEETFGLPPEPAARYTAILLPPPEPSTLAARLRRV